MLKTTYFSLPFCFSICNTLAKEFLLNQTLARLLGAIFLISPQPWPINI